MSLFIFSSRRARSSSRTCLNRLFLLFMPPPRPLASQADFDEAVATNVDDFDMSRAEAVVAALEELKLQVNDAFERR